MPIGYTKELDVKIQSQTEPYFQYFLMREQNLNVVLSAPVIVDTNKINVVAGHGFTAVANEMITLMEGNYMSQFLVTAVDVNELTIGGLTDLPYTVAAKVVRGNKDLATDGTLATPEEACFKFYDGTNNVIPIDLSTVVMSMVHTAASDDSKFGDQTALANPAYFRKIDGETRNLGFFKNNGDFRQYGGEVTYTDKAGGGAHSTSIFFDLIKIFTKEVRMDASLNDELCFYNPGLLSGLTSFYISIIGSLTSGE